MLKLSYVLPLAIVLTGCATATAHMPPPPVPAAWSVQQPATGLSADQWWRSANDTQLDQLVSEVDDRNHEIRIATARLREARANHVAARALLFPQVDAGGVAERGNQGLVYSYQTLNVNQGELDASYDLDLFGGNKARSAAAGANERTAKAGVEDVRAAVRLEVVSTYIGLRQTQVDLASSVETAKAAAAVAAYQHDQWQKGATTEAFWRSAQTDADAAEAAVSRLTAARAQYENALSVLIGDDELKLQSALDAPGAIPQLPDSFGLDVPISVVRRRPDIVEAENTLSAARASTKAAQAALLPDLSIGAFYGSQGASTHATTSVWNVAANFGLPLLNFGRVRAGIDAANAQEVQAYESYRLSVISALTEVRTRIATRDDARNRLQLAIQDETAQARRLTEAQAQYKAGLIPNAALQSAVIKHENAIRARNDSEAEVSLRIAALLRSEGY